MGGLHIAFNFSKVIDHHMDGKVLKEMWQQSEIMADGSITEVLESKA